MSGSPNKFISDTEFYRTNCSAQFPLFFQPYWLDALDVTWKAICMLGPDDKFLGAYVFCFTGNRVFMPALTPFLGPWMTEQASDKELFLLLQKAAEELSQFKFVEQKWSPKYINWLPFYWSKYNQTTRFTQLIKYNPDKSKISGSYKKHLARDIKYASRKLTARQFTDVPLLFSVLDASFKRRGMKSPLTQGKFENFLSKIKPHNCYTSIGCFSEDNKIAAAGLYVYDSMKCYYLMGGYEENTAAGSMALVIDQAISFAQERKIDFDFEGSMIPGINKFFSSFGTETVPYNFISKYRYTRYEEAKMLLKKILHG